MNEKRAPDEHQSLPISLGDHEVPAERVAMIKAHIATLSATALDVSDNLAFSADTSDFLRVLDDHAEDR